MRNHLLSVVMFGMFALSWAGHSVVGWRQYNEHRREHNERGEVGYVQYLGTGDFLESTFENWESEFFQLGCFLLFSSFLVQRGSAESKKPPEEESPEDSPLPVTGSSPWPVRHGGVALKLYNHSLTIALFALFALCFVLHGVTGRVLHNEDAASHGQPAVSLMGFVASSEFWYQSLQNWQSEFLAVFALVILSIFLRQKGSPESKPVQAPHSQTGTD